MSTTQKKRRSLNALLTITMASGLVVSGAGFASADGAPVNVSDVTCVNGRVTTGATISAGTYDGTLWFGPDKVALPVNNVQPGSYVIYGRTFNKVGGEQWTITVPGCRTEPTPTPTPTPSDTPHPTPTPTPTPEPVTSTVPGTTRTVIVTPAPVVKKVVPPATSSRTGVFDDGSWALVVLGLLLVGGALKYRRPNAGRRH